MAYAYNYRILIVLVCLLIFWAGTKHILPHLQAREHIPCYAPWSLPNTKLKDHSLFAYQDSYYLVSIQIDLPASDNRGEYMFAYARTDDFCTWQHLETPLHFGNAGDADEAYIWAPHVVQDGDTFYMFYTGVNRHIAQSIMLATSTTPDNPQSWTKHGVVFQPHHEGMVYAGAHAWSDARDPMVLAHNNSYFLYYTGQDTSGGIIGVAMADRLTGPWRDLGAILRTEPSVMPESPFVIAHEDFYYLSYNSTDTGQQWRWAPSPFGPWQSPRTMPFGWAYDFYFNGDEWLASYVIGNGAKIGIAPVKWDTSTIPYQLYINKQVFLPLIQG